MANTTNNIYSKLQQEKENLDSKERASVENILQGRASPEKIQEFLKALGSKDVAEILDWCGKQKNPSSWAFLAATVVPAIADQEVIVRKQDTQQATKLRSGFFNESSQNVSVPDIKPVA